MKKCIILEFKCVQNCVVYAHTFKALLALGWIWEKIQIEWELLSVEFPNLEEKN